MPLARDPEICPETLGPDHDFSSPPALVEAGGRTLLVLPQKSGIAWALDADREGELAWQYRIGQGTGLGGQWGPALDGVNAYIGVSDMTTANPGGIDYRYIVKAIIPIGFALLLLQSLSQAIRTFIALRRP